MVHNADLDDIQNEPVQPSFPQVLRQRIDDYFATGKHSRKGNCEMCCKLLFFFGGMMGLYLLLCLTRRSALQFVATYVAFGMAQLFLVVNIAHDSNHGSIFRSPLLNRIFSYSFDLIGVNSYMWRLQHNSAHHANINVLGEDEDVMARGLLRFSPKAPWRRVYRFQHIYAWIAYAFSTFEYVLYKDFESFFFPHLDRVKKIHHPNREYGILIVSKCFYLFYMLVITLLLTGHGLLLVLGSFVLAHCAMGLTAQCIFQTSHILGSSDFPEKRGDFESYTLHVVATTADYSTEGVLSRWLLGGLNCHVIHHLCPGVCHVHYPELTRILRETADECGVTYREHKTLWQAVASHCVHLKELGTMGVA